MPTTFCGHNSIKNVDHHNFWNILGCALGNLYNEYCQKLLNRGKGTDLPRAKFQEDRKWITWLQPSRPDKYQIKGLENMRS